MTLATILPEIWHRLMPKGRVSARSIKRLALTMARRQERMDRLNRVGITNVDADNFYDQPLKATCDRKRHREDRQHD